MTVENKTIIQKMMKELQLAKTEQNNNEVMKRHIANVKVLCELILEEPLVSSQVETSNHNDEELTNQEIKAMIGKKQLGTNLQQINDEKSTGDSLFDF